MSYKEYLPYKHNEKENTRLIEASLGHEYYSLKSININWATELHNNGNSLSINDLSIQAKHGLILWYLNDCFKIDCNINYNNFLKEFSLALDTDDIGFYQLKRFSCLLLRYNITSMKDFCNERHKVENMYKKMSTTKLYHLIKKDKNFKELILNAIKLVNLDELLKESTILDIFIANNPKIIDITIAYLRIKIILEKINTYDSNLSSIDILKISDFLDSIQYTIYNVIRSFKESNTIATIDFPISSKIQNFIEIIPDNKILDYVKVLL